MGSQPLLIKIFSKSGGLTGVQPPPIQNLRGGCNPPPQPSPPQPSPPPNPLPLFGAPECS